MAPAEIAGTGFVYSWAVNINPTARGGTRRVARDESQQLRGCAEFIWLGVTVRFISLHCRIF